GGSNQLLSSRGHFLQTPADDDSVAAMPHENLCDPEANPRTTTCDKGHFVLEKIRAEEMVVFRKTVIPLNVGRRLGHDCC
ncbi:hypothetical protein L9G16_23600, partial [Shewanella sp. A25]|nr:hypothetical protein [Shewanella shenzhenensis]